VVSINPFRDLLRDLEDGVADRQEKCEDNGIERG